MTGSHDRIGVLFVCLGNICRSPLAEGVFRSLVDEAGLAHRFEIDSAGTSGWHDGESADARTVAVARRRGVELTSISRRVSEADLMRFHHILAMDGNNLRELRRLARDAPPGAEIRLLREFDAMADGRKDVPDPWFSGEEGFEQVHDMVERSCRGLLAELRRHYVL
jgi:protein-tyrosine phosphatase